jgi:hypothetical protein
MKWTAWLLTIACISVLAVRLFIAFSSPELSGDEAYFHLRQVEHIRATGLPLFDDPLSYGGRTYFFSPVFHYLIAGSALVIPVAIAVKVVPNLFATLLMLIVFGIAQKLSKHDGVAFFIAVFSAFVPVWFGQTINTLSPATLAIPLLFFVIYAWLRVHEPRWRYLYLGALIVFTFVHPLALLFVLGLTLYLLLVLVERLRAERAELEIALFSIFFVLWSQFVLYKKFILAHGPAVIWQNIPPSLLSSSFAEVTILAAIYQIGILPVVYGVFVVYRYLFRRKQRLTYFLIAFTLAAGLLLWFRLIPVRLGLMLLGMFLLVLFSKWVAFFLEYIPTTRFPQWKTLFVLSLVGAFVLTSIAPSLGEAWAMQRQALSPAGVQAYAWIRDHTLPDAVVVAAVDEGHRVTALTGRKNVLDTHFLLQRDARKRLHDVNRIFTTTLGVEAIPLMDRYDASVILLSPATKQAFQLTTVPYADPSKCFARTFEEAGYEVFIKHPFCRVEEVA